MIAVQALKPRSRSTELLLANLAVVIGVEALHQPFEIITALPTPEPTLPRPHVRAASNGPGHLSHFRHFNLGRWLRTRFGRLLSRLSGFGARAGRSGGATKRAYPTK